MSWFELSTALVNTLAVAIGVLAISLPIALVLAVLTTRTNVLGGKWAWLAVCSQLAVPLYATVGAWSAGFGSQGWWPLAQAFVVRSYWTALASVIWIHALAAIPSAMLILSLGLAWTRRSQEEMALLDGGFSTLFFRVLIPNLRGWLAAAAFWVIVPVLTEMVVTNLYQLPTLPEQVYLDISLGTSSPLTYAVSLALCTLPLVAMAVALRRYLPSLSTFAQQMAQHPPTRQSLGSSRWFASVGIWSIVFVIVAVPMANLLLKVGWQSVLDASGTMQHRWTWSRMALTFVETVTLFTGEFRWTATLAVGASTLALCMAATLRWICRPGLAVAWMNLISVILIATPGPMVASVLSWLFLAEPIPGLRWLYDHSLAAPILAQQTRLLPLAWLIVGGILASISSQAWELALLDRLSLWMRWRNIVWPTTWRMWITAWLLLAAISAGELSTHLLLLPPGVTTVAQRLFEFLHFGMRYQDSGLCLALVFVGWLVAAGIWLCRK